MASTNIFHTDKDVIEKIGQKYGRTEKSLKEDVLCLKIWMKNQPHLPEILDDNHIKNFLILNKCSIEKTKRSIDMYYTLRTKIPEIYDNINPKCPNMQEITKLCTWIVLPKLTEEMYRIVIAKVLNKDMVDKIEPFETVKLITNLYEIRLNEDIIFGDILVLDMDGVNFSFITKITPSMMAKTLTNYEKVFSIPLKGLYLLNAPSFIGKVLVILKSLLKPKLFQRVHSCQDTSILNQHFPKSIMPKDYGGDELSIRELHELVMPKYKEYQKRFDDLDLLRVNEKLRPEELKNDEILGFYGNFKKIEVD